MPDKQLLKILSISSFITGAVIGLIPLIPPLVFIAYLLIMFCTAPFMLIYFKHLDLIKEITTEQTLIISAVSGAISFSGFSLIYFPLAFILSLIFKIQEFIWIKVLVSNFVFLVPMVVLMSLLSALLNSFSGFITMYLHGFFFKKR